MGGSWLGGFRLNIVTGLCTLHNARPARHSLRLRATATLNAGSVSCTIVLVSDRRLLPLLHSTQPRHVVVQETKRGPRVPIDSFVFHRRLSDTSCARFWDRPTDRLPRQFFGLGSLSFTPTDEPNRLYPGSSIVIPPTARHKIIIACAEAGGNRLARRHL